MKPNAQQQEVINHVDGPCVVTAVPGSGKTACLTERIKRLVEIGKAPSSILAITFTNKAAEEMRKRISQAVGSEVAGKMTILTFHSMCARILRMYGDRVGLRKGWTICDADDQERLVKEVAGRFIGDFVGKEYAKEVIAFLEGMRNACLSEHAAMQRYKLQNEQFDVARAYLKELVDVNCVDFTGLLSETLRILMNDKDVLKRLRRRWLYINVDEVQDTNIAQYQIIRLLGLGHRNVLVVGDLDQSIYAFRNANPENLLSFEKDFEAPCFKMETNYRSTPQILVCAQRLIDRNAARKKTTLRASRPAGPEPTAIHYGDDTSMADGMARKVKRMVMDGTPPPEIAIFYRVNYVSRILEQALREHNVRYRIIGGTGFYDRKEVKVSLAILRLLANPDDRVAFDHVACFCCKGVGPKSAAKVTEAARKDGLPVLEAARAASASAKGLIPLVECLTSHADDPGEALVQCMERTDFGRKLDKDSTDDNDRRGNVMEVVSDLRRFPADGLHEYLEFASLMSSQDDEARAEEISLMTMHAAKGLEFDHVLVSHAVGRIIPHARALEGSPEQRTTQMEEERRLFYVAMTRARQGLAIFSCARTARDDFSPSAFISQAGIELERRTDGMAAPRPAFARGRKKWGRRR
jgi:DNA helicase-2/ATP-dependent DNA helicase PcrA